MHCNVGSYLIYLTKLTISLSDYCKDHTERDRVTGTVTWGAIPVGQIRVGVCPHVNVHNRTSPVLITRQCIFDGEALWGNSTKLESCPATERMQILVDLPDEIKVGFMLLLIPLYISKHNRIQQHMYEYTKSGIE